MKTPISKTCVGLGLLLLLLMAVSRVDAQTPAPGAEATLSSFLREIVTNFVAFKAAFINTVEGTLGGYFAVLAYILAWIIAVYYFIQQFIQGEWDAAQIGGFTGSIVVCLLLLVFCGDLDNDGRRGDIVRMPALVGYHLAFGEDSQEPTGNYINRLVNEERTKFNTNYQKFIENKLMVKINDRDMPVRYPGMSGIVHMEKGRKRSQTYNNNPQWDVNKDGKVEQWEFGASAPKNLGAGMFFDANSAIGQIRAADPAKAKVLGKRLSADARLAESLANNQQTYDGKNQATGYYYEAKRRAEVDYTNESIGIADAKAQMQQQGIETQFQYSVGAGNTTYQRQSQAAEITRSGQLQSGQINYEGASQAAQLQFQGSTEASQITQKAALDALYKRNMANLVNSVGNSAAHQFSELFERASKGM